MRIKVLKNNQIKSKRGVKLKAPVIRKILKLRELDLSMNDITKLTDVSKGSVSNVLHKAVEATVQNASLSDLSNEKLLDVFYPPLVKKNRSEEPNFDDLKEELGKPCVNAQLLWEEYHKDHPNGMKRSTFYSRLKEAGPEESPKPSMHQVYKGGERLLIDYSGQKIAYYDKQSKRKIYAEVFVASWAASSYLYVEASHTQNISDWIASNTRALRFFGCAPTYLVPDNLKSGVTSADFHDPTINRAYQEMASHYGSSVLPTRARKPQDKAGVESNVRFIQTHILGRLRKQKFYSLDEINEAISTLLGEINNRPMQRYHRSRTERFMEIDKPNSTELPKDDFFVTEIKDNVKVGNDHHVPYNKHYYSVPWRLTGAHVDIWYSGSQIQIYHDGERVACHKYSITKGGYTTNDCHRPPNHLFVLNLKPLWVLSQAEKIGPKTHNILRKLIEANPRRSELAVRKGLGIIELAKDYPPEQVEAATVWAFEHGQNGIQDIRIVLEQGLAVDANVTINRKVNHNIHHDNIRGPNNYSKNLFNKGVTS